jgi:CubicO group peptidase (beta-lactamase class C family)
MRAVGALLIALCLGSAGPAVALGSASGAPGPASALSPAVTSGLANAATSPTTPAIDPIFAAFTRDNSPGCAVGIEHAADPAVLRFFGSADLEHRIPITTDTVFEAGSVSKQFTAAAILLLVQQGKLALSDDVRKYLPELPDYGTPITIDQLLNHTSGLRDWGDLEAIAGWPRGSRIYTLADVLDIASRQRALNFRPGSEWLYNNTGFTLLAIIVQRVSQLSLAEFTRQSFFVPLGMTHTQWRDDFRRIVPNRAIAYGRGKNGYEQNMPFENAYGNGGILTTIGDLLIWNRGLIDGAVKVAANLQTAAVLSNGSPVEYGRGLFIHTYRQTRELAHPGSTAGYRAWLGRYPDHQLSIALLCNAGDADNRGLAHQIADLYLPAVQEKLTEQPPAKKLAKLIGLYVDPDHGQVVQLNLQGSTLQTSRGIPLVALAEHRFRAGESIYEFTDESHFAVHNNDGAVLHFHREQKWTASAADIAELAGSYEGKEALVTYSVRFDTGQLTATPAGRPEATVVLRPVIADTFVFGEDGEGLVHFTRNSEGDIASLEITTMHVRRMKMPRSY